MPARLRKRNVPVAPPVVVHSGRKRGSTPDALEVFDAKAFELSPEENEPDWLIVGLHS